MCRVLEEPRRKFDRDRCPDTGSPKFLPEAAHAAPKPLYTNVPAGLGRRDDKIVRERKLPVLESVSAAATSTRTRSICLFLRHQKLFQCPGQNLMADSA